MAGGIDPDPKTLADLWRMARGAWDAPASLLALTMNLACDPEDNITPYTPDDCNPLRVSPPRRTPADDILPYDPAVLIAIASKRK